MSVLVALLLGGYIVFSEYLRVPKVLYLDFLRATSIVFFLAYVYAPLVFNTGTVEINQRFYWVGWVEYENEYLSTLALILALLGYMSIRIGFFLGKKSPIIRSLAGGVDSYLRSVSFQTWFIVGVGVLIIGLLFLELYTMRRGSDIATLLQVGGQLRVGEYVPGIADASFTFLTYAMVSIAGSFVFLGLANDYGRLSREYKGARSKLAIRWVLWVMLIGSVGLSLIVLLMRAGRLHLMNYLLVLVLVFGQRSRGLGKLLLLTFGVVLAVSIIVSGKFLLGVSRTFGVELSVSQIASSLALEIGFPYLSLISTLNSQVDFRWFIDVILALVYVFLVPPYVVITGSAPQNLPISVAKVNTINILGTSDLGEIPVDLVNLGYYSAHVFGVVVTGICFGSFLVLLERAFSSNVSSVIMSFRFALMVFMATVGLLYSDPVNLLRDGVYLWLPGVFLLSISFFVRWRS